MFEKLEEKRTKLLEQLENYYYFLKGWTLDELLEKLNKLTRKEKSFFNEINKKIKAIDLYINTESF